MRRNKYIKVILTLSSGLLLLLFSGISLGGELPAASDNEDGRLLQKIEERENVAAEEAGSFQAPESLMDQEMIDKEDQRNKEIQGEGEEFYW